MIDFGSLLYNILYEKRMESTFLIRNKMIKFVFLFLIATLGFTTIGLICISKTNMEKNKKNTTIRYIYDSTLPINVFDNTSGTTVTLVDEYR